MSEETLLAAIGGLRAIIDDFHTRQFPDYCKGMEQRLDKFERKNDQAHEVIIQAAQVTNGKVRAFELWQARIAGGMMFAKGQWQVFLGLVGGGGVAGVVMWLLGIAADHN
jgi:hypothetical protein